MRPVHEQERTSMLQDYLAVLRRRKWIVIQAVVIFPLVAVLVSLRETPLYSSSADVLLNQQDLAASLTGTNLQVYQDPIRLVQTQADLARVPAVAQQVLRATPVPGMTPQSFLASSSVTARQDADLLEFTVTDRHPGIAERLATSYARQYTIYRYHLDTSAIENALSEVRSRLQELGAAGRGSSLYGSLREKEQQLRTIAALKTSNASLVRPADGAGKVRPRPVRNGILGLGLGLVLGVVLAFVKEALDTRVRSADDVAEELGLTLLARLPEPRRPIRKRDKLVMTSNPSAAEAEPFRILKTGIEFVNMERGARTIMVTSAVEQEGKSTTVANLAVAFARAGKRVTLVDLDLRRPFLHRFFRTESVPGVTDVALGRSDLGTALVHVGLGRGESGEPPSRNGGGASPTMFDVLTSGSTPPDPGEFIASHALSSILDDVAADSDLVFVDSPPLLHLGDAVALSAKVDGLIVVVSLKVATHSMLRELRRVLENCGATKLGFVLADAEEEEGYDYGRGYYYAQSSRSTERQFARRA